MDLRILIDAWRARTSDDFLIRDVPGTSGRLDVICRILVSAYRTIPKLAPNIQVNAVLGGPPNPPLRLQVKDVVPYEFPNSELECALILKDLFYRYRTLNMSQNTQWPQFSIKKQDFRRTLKDITQDTKQIFYLVESGQLLEKIELDLDQPIVLILGDDQGLTDEHKKEVYTQPIQEVSIGTRSLLGSQVISLVLLEMMRRNEK